MPVKLAKTAGFCWGVRRAMKIALDTASGVRPARAGGGQTSEGGHVYLLGRLIHNQQAIDLLKSKGIRIIEGGISQTSEEIGRGRGGPPARAGVVILRAHGATPDERCALEAAGLTICDATCPHVAKAQAIVRRSSAQGATCIIVGDKGHAEVLGLLGCAGERGIVIPAPTESGESPEDLNSPDVLPARLYSDTNVPAARLYCVVAQTTQNREQYQRICAEIVKRFPHAEIHNTICEATARRQDEALAMARQVDAMIIVGDRESANTRRLVELARSVCANTFHVQGADELDLERLKAFPTIGVTAGASTPHWVIRNVVEELEMLQRRQKPFVVRTAHALFAFIIQSQLFLALGAAALTAMATLLMRQALNPLYSLLAFFYVLSMHVLNKYLGLPRDRTLLFGAYKYFSTYQRLFLSVAVASLFLSLIISLTLGVAAFVLMLLSMILGAVYSFAIVPRSLAGFIRYRRLMDIPGSKDLFMAAAWAAVVVLVPFLESAGLRDALSLHDLRSPLYGFALSGLFVFLLVLTRAIAFDVRDIEGDIVLGRETLPIIFGRERVQRVLRIFLGTIFLIPLVGYFSQALPALAVWEEITVIYVALLLHLPMSQEVYQSVAYDALLDAQFLLAGALALGWVAII